MKILYHSRFGREYKKLPAKVQGLAEEQEKRFRKNPFDPRLRTHKLHGPLKDFWAFSVDHRYRVMFDFTEKDVVRFYTIGDHDIYE